MDLPLFLIFPAGAVTPPGWVKTCKTKRPTAQMNDQPLRRRIGEEIIRLETFFANSLPNLIEGAIKSILPTFPINFNRLKN
jgi:hypothetical protein